MPTNTKLNKAVKLALAMSSGAFALSFASPAVAQNDGSDDLEEVLVTGSRIPRKDFTSNAPVATIDAGQIELTNTINTESLLNTLPQTVPGLDRTSNNPGNGTATVDLRGLGTNRTLVLINGTRAVPTTLGGTVDINTIPNALIKDVEVLTGGASAVYGSDAVAGVVNFILKDDFEGATVNVSHEVTQEGDASLTSADITIGANMADDRGNVVFNFAVTDRDDLFQGDRDFAFFAQFDDVDANGNPILIDGGSTGVPGTSVFAGALGGPLGGSTDPFSDSFGGIFDADGSFRPFRTGETNDFYNYAPVNYIQLPQTRYQASALGTFKATDNLELYGRAMFTYSKVPQQLAPTPIFASGTQFTLDGSPFITPASQAILSEAFGDGVDTDNDGIDDTATMFVRRRLEEVGPRIADDTRSSFQVQAGLRGNITDTWSYDAYVQTGRVTNAASQSGNVNRDRFQQALLLDLAADPSGNTCVDPSANGSTSACAPINIFGPGNISAAGAAFLRTAVASTTEFEQLMGSVTVSGDLGAAMELPGGRIGVAVGYEHREDDGFFLPSQDLAAGTIAGFNGSPASGGGFDVDAIYGEAYLPVLDNLEIELAARSSDYSTAGSVSAYKVAGSWQPIDQLRIRGGYNTAVRAPNIAELFSPQSEGFPGAADPCSLSGTPAAGLSATAAATCAATGVPTASIGTAAINPASGQVRAISGGNPDLTEEEAETITFGVVVTPDFVEGLTFSIDYFDIEIDDAIAAFGGGAANVLNNCYSPDNTAGAASDFCQVITRRADGTIDNIALQAQNVALQTLKGIDLAASYNTEFYGGDLGIQYLGTITTENDFTAFDGDDPIECAGKFGNLCGEPIQEYGHRVSFNWNRDAWTAQVVWRYVGETDDDDDDTTFFVETLDAENYIDVSGSYAFNDRYSLSFGIDNLFDTDPPIIGDNQEQANTFPATYDVFGRTFFLRGSATF
ncbi:MAG: TonB-dependent receptor [Pseudomonadota bacterium]